MRIIHITLELMVGGHDPAELVAKRVLEVTSVSPAPRRTAKERAT